MFDIFDTLIDEHLLSNSDDTTELELAEKVRVDYYALADKLATLIPTDSANTSHNSTGMNTTMANTSFGTQSLAKLPTAQLPKFDGNFENWISFKNTFKTLIDY